jgi:phosphatidylserine decarboxylase
MPLSEVPLVECVCWDKDRWGKDYMGEFDIAVEDIFADGKLHQEVGQANVSLSSTIADIVDPQPKWYKLKSKRKSNKKSTVSGEVQMQFSLTDTYQPTATEEETLHKYKSVIAAGYEDDDEILSRALTIEDEEGTTENGDDAENDHETSDETDEPSVKVTKKEKKKRMARLRRKSIAVRAYEFVGGAGDVSGIIFMEILKITDLPPERNCK